MSTDVHEAPVLVHRDGRAGRIVLNRPRALNALSHEMVLLIAAALDAWEHDDAVERVVVSGARERGLCAGGDIRAIHQDAVSGDGEATRGFWRDEYRLNARIARYPKPYVAVMDGIVMGGGVGVSAHGSVRIVTERTQLAMPETRIGLVPDVGGTFLLSRAPGELGTHLALTAGTVGPGDALLCGLADHYVPSDRLPELLDDLAVHDLPKALELHTRRPPAPALADQRPWIDACYAAGSVERVLENLSGCGQAGADEAARLIAAHSPTALKATLASLRRARRLATLEAVLDQEFRVSCRALGSPDLAEGIRAQVVDKDRTPRWNPPTLAAVPDEATARFFARLGDRELGLAAH